MGPIAFVDRDPTNDMWNNKPVRWPVVLLAIVAQFSLLLLVNWPSVRTRFPLLSSTAGASWLGLLIVVGGLIMLWGGLRLRDLGLDWTATRIVQALIVSASFWIALQLLLGAVVIVKDGAVMANPVLTRGGGAGLLAGLVVEQWLGNALYEEVVFRGFLLVQIAMLLGRGRSASGRRNLLIAVITSQLVFALMHLPHRVLGGITGTGLLVNLALLFVGGLVYSALYLRTKNLLLVIGLHGLFNRPVALVQAHIDTVELVWGLLAIVLILIWPRVSFQLRPEHSA